MMEGLCAEPSRSEMMPTSRFSWRGLFGFVFPFLRPRGHETMMGEMEGGEVRLIFSQLTWPNGEYAPPDKALNFMVKHLPLLKVDMNYRSHTVEKVERTPKRNLWGQMPMPLL
jgi:hypothetical protein